MRCSLTTKPHLWIICTAGPKNELALAVGSKAAAGAAPVVGTLFAVDDCYSNSHKTNKHKRAVRILNREIQDHSKSSH